MSGGYWNYTDSTLASEVFNYYLRFDNGLRGEKNDKEVKSAKRIKPLKRPSFILFYHAPVFLFSYAMHICQQNGLLKQNLLELYRKELCLPIVRIGFLMKRSLTLLTFHMRTQNSFYPSAIGNPQNPFHCLTMKERMRLNEWWILELYRQHTCI